MIEVVVMPFNIAYAQSASEKIEVPGRDVPWTEIGRIAHGYVNQESPATVWPFDRASALELQASARKVFVHYFPPHPISIDNLPAVSDYWNVQYLQRTGEGGKYASKGGLVRQRPLAAGPWPSPYWREINAAIDVLRAQLIGIDGFGVDIVELGSGRHWDQALRLCAAAAALAPGFYFVPEFDGGILSKATSEQIVDAAIQLAACPSIYRLPDGRILFVPFAPDTQTPAFWKAVEDGLSDRGIKIAFVPDLLDLGRNADPFAPISAGLTFWGPRDTATADSSAVLAIERKAAALAPNWMQPVAAQDARPNQSVFWEADNTALFRDLWMQAIEKSSPFVHIITWNDYTEGTEIAPSSGSQFLFYDLAAYYIQWFKLGHAPHITRDAVFYSHRTQIFHPDQPVQAGDAPFKQLGAAPLRNDVEALVLLKSPAKIEIDLADHTAAKNVPAGLQVLCLEAAPGRPVFRILRNGHAVMEQKSAWEIEASPARANPDYFGGSSTRAVQSIGN